MGESRNPIVFVLGPTASGKSDWALKEAKKNAGVILNADSIQIYRDIHIGAAKPSLEDQKTVPHFLYDQVPLDLPFTAGDYRRLALKVIEEQVPKAPVYIVGGSGFYIQALDKGMFEVGEVSDSVTKEVESFTSNQEVWERLKELDPETAQGLSVSDSYRIRRALELVLNEKKTMREIKTQFAKTQKSLSEKYTVKKIGFNVNRDELRRRVEKRTSEMLKNGLLDEVRTLIKKGYQNTKALRSVGYAECVQCLSGELEQDQLQGAIIISTMQLAKRQMTWFRRDTEIDWLSPN